MLPPSVFFPYPCAWRPSQLRSGWKEVSFRPMLECCLIAMVCAELLFLLEMHTDLFPLQTRMTLPFRRYLLAVTNPPPLPLIGPCLYWELYSEVETFFFFPREAPSLKAEELPYPPVMDRVRVLAWSFLASFPPRTLPWEALASEWRTVPGTNVQPSSPRCFFLNLSSLYLPLPQCWVFSRTVYPLGD